MKKVLIYILTTFTILPIFSQNWEYIKNSSAYLYGEGWGVTISEARENALNDLISKIKVQVTGEIKQLESEGVVNDSIDAKREFVSKINTYSQATLTNTQQIIVENEPDAYVVRYIKRSELNRIFEGRKQKALDYVSSAQRALELGKIDVALKDYYWALMLVESLQYPNEAYYTDELGRKQILTKWIPEEMNKIFSNLKIEVASRKNCDVELRFTHNKNVVTSIDYTYFDGRDWSNIYSAKDGCGVLELAPGNISETYQVKIEYEYRGESHIDKEVESVMAMTKSKAYRKAYINVESDVVEKKEAKPIKLTTTKNIETIKDSEVVAYHEAIKSVEQALTTKHFKDIEPLFTTEGYEIFNSLLKYGNAKVVGIPQYTFIPYNDYVIARGLQMSFTFANSYRKSFVEDVIFTFDKDKKIANIAFGLGDVAEKDILYKGSWSTEARMALMHFLENYQTAYALKRHDYISRIFDDDAVIITVTVLPTETYKKTDTSNTIFDNKIIKENRYTKDSYLKQLERSFAGKEYINLRFADNDVRKLGRGGEVYAIQISQEYYSSNYGDKVYLFLMLDMNDPEKPLIKIRTWQPEKDPTFGVFGPEHFK